MMAKPLVLSSKPSIQETNLKLLEDGLFADSQVRCGERAWNTHRVILCTRSEWFKKALLGPFEEGKTGKIVITEFQEQEVEALLTFLYGGEIDMKKSFPKDNMYVALIKLWKLADFFCLDFLRTIVNKARIWHTTDLACQLCSISGHSNFDTVTVVEALRVLYTTDTGGARTVFQPALVNLAVAGCKILSKDVAFQALLKDSHDFAADWATKLAVCLAKAEDLVVPVHRRTYCFAECYQKLESDADGFFDPVSWNNQGVVMPVCRKCMLASFRAEGEESD